MSAETQYPTGAAKWILVLTCVSCAVMELIDSTIVNVSLREISGNIGATVTEIGWVLGTQGWSPVQNVESICMSLQSMLTGNTKNERPEGDYEFVKYNRKRPRDIDFYYHDDGV